MVELLDVLGLTRSDAAEFAVLRQVRGHLVKRPRAGGVEVVATGRADWVGWVELTTEPVTEAAVANTARVIADVVSPTSWAWSRPRTASCSSISPMRSSWTPTDAAARIPQIMLIDGNDDRGIDVAVLTKRGWPLGSIRTHVDDTDAAGVIFSRDCPEYEVRTPGGSSGRRPAEPPEVEGLRQAVRQRRQTPHAKPNASPTSTAAARRIGVVYVAVLGDFNDTPGSEPLAPLLAGTDLRDIATHPTSTTAADPARSATAPPRRRSTTSCCHRPCTRKSQAAESTGSAPGAARTAPCGRTTTLSPRRSTPHPTTAPSMPTSG